MPNYHHMYGNVALFNLNQQRLTAIFLGGFCFVQKGRSIMKKTNRARDEPENFIMNLR